MDKNTIIGLVIIFLILIGFSYFTRPSEEQLKEIQRQDSIARVEAQRMQLAAEQERRDFELAQQNDTASVSRKDSLFMQDSLREQLITLENDKIKLQLNTKGGRIVFVDLKEYRTHDSLPLVLWKGDETTFG